jgi:hypothetical protein
MFSCAAVFPVRRGGWHIICYPPVQTIHFLGVCRDTELFANLIADRLRLWPCPSAVHCKIQFGRPGVHQQELGTPSIGYASQIT